MEDAFPKCHSGDDGNGTRGSVSQRLVGTSLGRPWALISLLPSTLCPCRKLVPRDPLVPENCADNPFSQEPAPTGKGGGQYIFDRSHFSTKGRSSLALGSVVSAGEGGMTFGEQWG